MMKKRTTATDALPYATDQTMSLPRRAAHFLDWAAQRYPRRYWSPAELWQHIMVLPRAPRETDFNRKAVSAIASRARSVLQELYGRTIVTQRGLGVRASVDSEDVNDNCLPRRLRAARTALGALDATAEFVKPEDLPAEKREKFEAVSATLVRLRRGKFLDQLNAALQLPEHAGENAGGS